MRILVQNKQRQHKVDLFKLETMSNKLALAVFDNFRTNKPKEKWTRYLRTIEELAFFSLIVVSPPSMKKLNKRWLQKDKETDVLSFPLLDLSSPNIADELRMISSHHHSEQNMQNRNEWIEFGEIYICYAQAIRQAQEYNHSLERELAFLSVHGLLHIFGFDHQDKEGEKEMFGRQHVILSKAGYSR